MSIAPFRPTSTLTSRPRRGASESAAGLDRQPAGPSDETNEIACASNDRTRRVSSSAIVRGVFAVATLAFLGLAAAGAVLPLVPTTPFLLLAVACASRVSSSWRERLLASRWGTPVRQWREHRAISLDVRRRAGLAIALVAAVGVWGAAGDLRLLVPVTVGSTIGLVALYRLPLIERRRV